MDALLVALAAAVLGAYLGHRGWLRQARAEHYAAFVTSALTTLRLRIERDHYSGDKQAILDLQENMRAFQMVRMFAGPEVEASAQQLFTEMTTVSQMTSMEATGRVGAAVDAFREDARQEVVPLFPWRLWRQRVEVRPEQSRENV
ncbi:hypothetical protein WDZ16_13005 [Pseudokineococcus marinus]|uniref:Uncharacterized protein n=1 Tax=Pseudokineococcus marinus TaxID=351215 RepID=A0A849BK50_9ACTN|nr:hypothetical protein [Pseudokineococcus marinus]NNH21653.1 hypothetical protein [Pseudokineococcus marinus]